jgi:hypothetical protein
VALAWPNLAAANPSAVVAAPAAQPRAADFRETTPSDEARRVADWVVVSNDAQGLAFMIVDKLRATVFVFDADGRLLGSSLALLGRAKGDDSPPGIGARRLHSIRPEERTTPAGRFVATLGKDFEHDVVWIDYDNAISMHRVVHGDPGDNRQQRLSTTNVRDKRISYGCVNVPAKFYDDVVLPVVSDNDAVVYILPETKTLAQVFGISDIALPAAR